MASSFGNNKLFLKPSCSPPAGIDRNRNCVALQRFCSFNFSISRFCSVLTCCVVSKCLLAIYLVDFPAPNTVFPFLKTLTLEYEGFARWNIYYKLAMLRQISYGIDYQQALRRPPTPILTSAAKLPASDSSNSSDKYELAEMRHYSLSSLYAYTFYLPLYIAGPIATFSNFVRDCEHRQTKVSLRSILIMFVQVTVYTIAVEIWLHYIYVYSWNFEGQWEKFTPAVLSMICFWTLHHMYVKFTVIWRSFRAMALLDGIGVVRPFAGMVEAVFSCSNCSL